MNQETPRSERSVPQLLRELTGEISTLIRKETQLLKTEAYGAVHDVKVGVASSGVGLAVLTVGLFWLLGAAVYGLALELPMWLSALIVGGATVAIGAIMLAVARSKMSTENMKPTRTQHQLREDAQTARRHTA